MKKSFLKVTSFVLMIMLIVSVFSFTACKKQDVTTKDTTEQATVQEKITLTKLGYLKPEIDSLVSGDPNQTPLYEELEKRTNVHINWIMTPAADFDTKMMLLISSGKQPDLMYVPQTYPGGADQAILDGLIVDLAVPENAQYCPNYMKALNSQPGWKRELSDDQKRVTGFAQLLVPDGSTTVCLGPMLREDFLAKIGKGVPETIQEWHDVLKAFKDQKLCKSPLTGFFWILGYSQAFVGAYGTTITGWNDTQILPNTQDKMVFGPIQPAFKDFLAMFNSWYKEGLIDPDMFNLSDWGLLDAKLTSSEAGATVHFLSKVKKYTDSLSANGGAMVAAPYPVLNKGDKPIYGQGNAVVWGIDSVSAKSKYVKEAIKYRDYGYTDDGYLLMNFGIEGKTYTMVDGKPKYSNFITDCITNKDGKNSIGLTLDQAYGLHVVDNQPTFEAAEYFTSIRLVDDRNRNACKVWSVPQITTRVLNITFNKQELEDVKALANIMTYTNEMTAKFIQGTEKLDKFDDFVAKCKDLGIDKVIEVYNAAYDRYKAR